MRTMESQQLMLQTGRADVTAKTTTLVSLGPDSASGADAVLTFRAQPEYEGDRAAGTYLGRVGAGTDLTGSFLVLEDPRAPLPQLAAELAEPKVLHRLGLRAGDLVRLRWN